MKQKLQWTTTGFNEFRKGTFGNGGQNLYVSKAGVLQRIYQFDLNRNGYIDLVFANCQDHHESAESYVYNLKGECVKLPGQGSVCGTMVDLNNNGYQDLIITGRYNMVTPFASTDIYFGSPEGYSENNHIRIPTPWAEDCCHGHFDRSSRVSLAFAMPYYKTVRIFHQTELGLEWDEYTDYSIEANLISAIDLDGDGYDELIVRKQEQTETTIYWGSPDGIKIDHFTVLPELPAEDIAPPDEERSLASKLEEKFQTPRLLQCLTIKGRNCFTLSTGKQMLFYSATSTRQIECILKIDVPMAMAVAAGDINGNGYPDLAFACRAMTDQKSHQQKSFIYWGSENGYSTSNKTVLETCQACDVSIYDLNDDGCSEVLFVQNYTEDTYSNDSLLFFGSSTSGINPVPLHFRGEDSRRGFLLKNPVGEPEIFLLNHFSRSSVGYDRSYIYWGSKKGYSAENRQEVPSWCAVDSLIADLDDDGRAELVIANNSENSLLQDPGHFIHYFGDQGFIPEKSRSLKTDLGWGVLAGDFNHDGYLEIITPCNFWQDLRIFYGKDNFETYDTINLGGIGSPRWICAADLNNNGWLDLIVPVISANRSLILWGGPDGYSLKNRQELAVIHGVSATAADLTGNGYPDIIIGGHTVTPRNGDLPLREPLRSFLHIYWNGPEGISENKKCLLRADSACSIAVADFNNDGWLDIFTGSYHGGKERDVNSFLYWNREGKFHELDRELIFTHSASGCIAADFNEDGYVDLAVANHKVDGDHVGFSSVWWNGPNGFNAHHRTDLPTRGPHGMISVDPGNILTRGPEEYYESDFFQTDATMDIESAVITADIPPKTWVKIFFRIGKNKEEIKKSPWLEAQEIHTIVNGILQYRLAIGAVNSLRTPRITKIEINLQKK